MAVIGWLLGNWRVVGIGLIVLFAVSVAARFHYLEAQHEKDETALAHARQAIVALQRQARVDQSARHEADTSVVVNRQSADAVYASQREVANAADAATFYASWVAGIGRVRDAGSVTAAA